MLEASAIKHLVVHCSDTPDEEDIGAREIHAMHLGFGWHGVGYHRVIKRDGTVEQARPDFWQGAHVYGHNEISLGVCLIGRHEFTAAQFDTLEAVLRQWQKNHTKYGKPTQVYLINLHLEIYSNSHLKAILMNH